VKALLMGGQACVLYGAAEFSRDVDFLVEPSDENLSRLRAALRDLRAVPIAIPTLNIDVLDRGFACHFRCRAREAARLRIDIMSRLRGCDDFAKVWARRRAVRTPRAGVVAVMHPADLLQSKKTQRDKDWPMIARLVESDYRARGKKAAARSIQFWLLESRTAELLLELVGRFPAQARRLRSRRAAIRLALARRMDALRRELIREQEAERSVDRDYWLPRRRQLETWRLERGSRSQ